MRQYHSEQYERRIVFTLRHSCFAGGEAPVALSASAETDGFLQRNNAVFRCDAPGCWSVCVPSERYLEADDTCGVLRFEIRPRSGHFYYYSQLPEAELDGWSVRNGDNPGVWKTIEVSMDEVIRPGAARTINIWIQAVEKYMEFFFIPKYNPPDAPLRVTVSKGDLLFSGPENTSLWEYGPVQRVVSVKPLPVNCQQLVRVMLWEIRNGGDRLLSDSVPWPPCDSPSPASPENTITTYFYY